MNLFRFGGDRKLSPNDIQKITLEELKRVGAHILKSTPYSLSNEPGEGEDVQVPDFENCFIIGAIMTKDSYYDFRAKCNARGVWINAKYWEFDRSGTQFEYSIQAVQLQTRR
jgi:hypothetical protein